MWPFKKKYKSIHSERIQWGGAQGTSRAKCTFCDRNITQSETDITYHSIGSGEMRPSGKVECSICGAIDAFDRRSKEVEIR